MSNYDFLASKDDFLTRIHEYTREIEVSIDKLYLDPNNPRFKSLRKRKIPPSKYLTEQVITSTFGLMTKENNGFDIPGMMSDFLEKGFIDGDEIIVQKIDDHDGYIVREGNRRITAIKQLLSDEMREIVEERHPGLCEELSVIPVTEVVREDLTDEQLTKVVDQMLGVRHLNQCKQWPPFVRGEDLYRKYLNQHPAQIKESFRWDEERGGHVAKGFLEELDPALKDLLPKKGRRKISQENTKDILKTIRVMEQLSDIEGVIINKQYYSLFEELAVNASPQLREYFPLDEENFHLSPTAVEKVIQLCALLDEKREGASIHNPQQWRFLSRILDRKENEPVQIDTMVSQVFEGESPEDVWHEREAQRQSFSWASWLEELTTLLTSSKMEYVPQKDPRTSEVLGEMWVVLDELEARQSRS